MAERIGLNGRLALCTLGKPYKMPGLEPVGVKRSYSSSEIMLSFLRESRKLRRSTVLCSVFMLVPKMTFQAS